ncbi:MAG: amino acid ABC transporter permease [Gemmataceae bacterium]
MSQDRCGRCGVGKSKHQSFDKLQGRSKGVALEEESSYRWVLASVVLLLGPAGTVWAEPVGGSEREAVRARLAQGVLRWGGDAEGGAPYQLRDPQDPARVIGFEVELADALAQTVSRQWDLPLRAEFVQYEWVSLAAGLDKGDFDVILSGYEITPERAHTFRFTRPYYVYRQHLTVRQDDERIRSLADCLDKPVGTLAGSAAEELLQKAGVRDIVAFDGQVEPYLELVLGRVDAVLLDGPIATYYGRQRGLKTVDRKIGKGFYGIALRNDDVVLAAALDRALSHLMIEGTLRRIYRRWHIWNEDQAELAHGPKDREELAGLGFDATGKPATADEPPPDDAVDIDILAASAREWTFDHYGPLLLQAAGMTVFLTVTSMALAMALGLVIAMLRLYAPPPVNWLALAYVEFFRGVPLLLILFFLYFGLSSYGIGMPALVTAIVGFGLNYAAYEAEIYRSSILAVPEGQWEAGRALGMSDTTIFRRIVLPQALRTALAPMTNDFVALFKDTSLVSVIAVRELTKEYLILARSSLKFVELGILTALLYLIMSVPLGYLSRYLERRWSPERQGS